MLTVTLDRTHGETLGAAQGQGGRNTDNFTTAVSCFFKIRESTLPRMAVSVGSGSVVLRALALLDTRLFETLPNKSSQALQAVRGCSVPRMQIPKMFGCAISAVHMLEFGVTLFSR